MKILKNFYLHLFIYVTIQCLFFLRISDIEIVTNMLHLGTTIIFFLFLSQLDRRVFRVGIILSFIIVLFMYPIIEVYGDINYSFFSSLLYTNTSEVFSYVKIVPFKVYVYLLLYFAYTVYLLKLNYKPIPIKYISFILGGILLFFPIRKVVIYDLRINFIDKYFNVQPIKRVVFAIKLFHVAREGYEEIMESLKRPSDWRVENMDDVKLSKNFVIVIGESVRRDFLHSYGFNINNTPFLDAVSHIQFENYISVAPSTVMFLSRTLTLSSIDLKKQKFNNSIINLAKLIGYKTYWVSNQDVLGWDETPNSVIAYQSDEIKFLRTGKIGEKKYQDGEMLPYITDFIQRKTKNPKLIVVHMMGSHVYACDQTQNKYDEFIISKEISCYNKSIRNLDLFLKNIYNKLKETGEDFNLVYFSDHGQVVKGKSIMHGRGNHKEDYNVPLIIMNNKGDRMKINQMRKGSDFLHLFSEMNNVKTKNLKRNYRFISEDKVDEKHLKVLDASEKLVEYDKLSSNSINEIINQK